jgi:phosphate transport system substrate-binding protein
MKKLICVICAIAAFYGCSKEKAPAVSATSGSISISGAWALYPLVVKWSEVYQKKYPDVRIDVSAGGAGKGMVDALARAVDLGMISREINKIEIEKGIWWVSVAKDAVIPTLSQKNPLRVELLKRGLTRNEFTQIWITGKIRTWNVFAPAEKNHPVHVYTRSDACGAAETWAKYVGGFQEDLMGVGVYGDPGLVEAVRADPLAIGYNNMNFAYDANTKKPVRGITPLPIDINGNGRIDPDESFYADRESLATAIAVNKFPSPPARNLLLVSRGIPEKRNVLHFLIWILDEGQRYVAESGYIALQKQVLSKGSDELRKKLQEPR